MQRANEREEGYRRPDVVDILNPRTAFGLR